MHSGRPSDFKWPSPVLPGTEPVDHQTWRDGQISLPTFHDTKVKLRFISDLLHLS